MQEVPWQNLEVDKEYYIERILPREINQYGTPKGQKKKGIFVGIEYDHGVPYTKFRNLINPPRNTEGPDLPSVLGTVKENSFSTNVVRFYRPVSHQIALNQVERKFGDMTNTNFGETAILNNPYLGGKKSRRTKKSKKTKKSKRSKKSRKNKKRH